MTKIQKLSIIILAVLLFSSCEQRLGYGVLLWSIEEPPIPSGTILPVYIRSNIEQIWVVGIPEEYRRGNNIDKMEIPLAHFEFIGNRRKTEQWAEEFSRYGITYAENLQDGLPIRDGPDNNARRVYRLRLGEIIKVLETVRGVTPISTTGDPLTGEWLKVLTHDGVIGYCFSYRLNVFNQNEESISAPNITGETVLDTELEMVLSRTWSAEIYSNMVTSRRFNIQQMQRHYRFDPGQDTGVARIFLPNLEREFRYDRIVPDGERAWRFEDTTLSMVLRSNSTLAVQFTDTDGSRRTHLFVNLTTDVNDLIVQENARRENQFKDIYNEGPVFTSINYGTISLISSGDFVWKDFDLLVPHVFPAETGGQGRIEMDLYISPSYEDRYIGAFTLQFTDVRQNNIFYFMYGVDNQGLRLEIIPEFGIEDMTVMRRAATPTVMYFYRDTSQ